MQGSISPSMVAKYMLKSVLKQRSWTLKVGLFLFYLIWLCNRQSPGGQVSCKVFFGYQEHVQYAQFIDLWGHDLVKWTYACKMSPQFKRMSVQFNEVTLHLSTKFCQMRAWFYRALLGFCVLSPYFYIPPQCFLHSITKRLHSIAIQYFIIHWWPAMQQHAGPAWIPIRQASMSLDADWAGLWSLLNSSPKLENIVHLVFNMLSVDFAHHNK